MKNRTSVSVSLLVLLCVALVALAKGDPSTESAPAPSAFRRAFEAYGHSRDLLAHDRFDEVPLWATQLSEALRSVDGSPAVELPRLLEEGAEAADSLAQAEDLPAARLAFGEVSRLLIEIAGRDSSLQRGWYLFECPMAPGFKRWMQPFAEPENPYMGQAMPSCGSSAGWDRSAPRSAAAAETEIEQAHGSETIAYYTCSMHPSVQRQQPGTCPICSMDLVPVTHEERETGVIQIDAGRRQLIGVRTAVVSPRSITVRIRAVGTVTYDETRLADVSVKYRGWIGELLVDRSGQKVEKGQTLFTLYSPELYAAQEEFLAALQSQLLARLTTVPDRADYLVEASRKRLHLWDIRDWQIDRIAADGKPREQIPIVSPVSGHVVEKNVVQGAAVEPGNRLYRIAGLETVWIEAEVYENELALIEVGQPAEVRLPHLRAEAFHGSVSFIYPYLETSTRTGKVRIELDNTNETFKAEMYADVEFMIDRGRRLAVPVEAVLYAGPRRLVFVDLGQGRLKPQEIELGARSGDYYEVRSGLAEGQTVVTSGNFLIAAESRLKSAGKLW